MTTELNNSEAQKGAQEYDGDLIALLQGVWGEGFMSPGGPEEIDRILDGLDLTGYEIIDIGCGLGGADIHIAQTYHIQSITGLDIEADLIKRCQQLATSKNAGDKVRFHCVEPGPLPFEASSVHMVFSKDAIIHISDKQTLAVDIYRVLKPGGWFAASDWLAGHDGEPTAEMKAYVEAEGLDFGLAGPETYERALSDAGFVDVELNSRNEWYRTRAREERDNLAGPLYEDMVKQVGQEFVDHEIDVWNKMIVALDQGEMHPTHIRARK